jgi:tRNA-splicing ligase RtcB
MRLVRTNLTEEEVRPRLDELVDRLFGAIPAGVGGSGMINLGDSEFLELVERGLDWALDRGFATDDDLEHTEEHGRMDGADPSKVSVKAVKRGRNQVGTLGSGNHYLEIQVAHDSDVSNAELAKRMGIDRDGQVVVMVHTGSRGFGHQIATDYLRRFVAVMNDTYHLGVDDRELACAPFRSREGQDYFAAMKCAVNMAFCNRQMIIHRTRDVFSDVFGRSPRELGMSQIYDVTHNTAKLERHVVDGEARGVLVHRKGATRAFGPGMSDVPAAYRDIGQPVIIGGSMETGSYLLVGTGESAGAFFTTAHGSGRTMGRRAAKKQFYGEDIQQEMHRRGIEVRAVSMSGLAEEAGGAYKSIDAVVDAAAAAGLSRKVVRLVPIGNIKG